MICWRMNSNLSPIKVFLALAKQNPHIDTFGITYFGIILTHFHLHENAATFFVNLISETK